MPTDISIPQVGLPNPDPQKVPRQPCYLVVLEGPKKDALFIAVKFEERPSLLHQFVGFYCDKKEQDIIAHYDEIIRSTDKQNFVDIRINAQRIKSVRSLVYRHK